MVRWRMVILPGTSSTVRPAFSRNAAKWSWMLESATGSAPAKKASAAIARRRQLHAARIWRGTVARAPIANPESIHSASILSQTARPNRKKPAASQREFDERWNFTESSRPAPISRCWKATGPQSKVVVSRYWESAARMAHPMTAARAPTVARRKR